MLITINVLLFVMAYYFIKASFVNVIFMIGAAGVSDEGLINILSMLILCPDIVILLLFSMAYIILPAVSLLKWKMFTTSYLIISVVFYMQAGYGIAVGHDFLIYSLPSIVINSIILIIALYKTFKPDMKQPLAWTA